MSVVPIWARDWRGQTVVVAASGPSQTKDDLDYCRGRCRVVVINSTWRLAPWADLLYFCDATWWHRDGPKRHEFPGYWITGKTQTNALAGTFSANVEPQKAMIWDGKRIGGGQNSGFQVLNLLTVWRVARVIFLGLDCKLEAENGKKPVHWHGPHREGGNPTFHTTLRWRECFEQAAPEVAERGVAVFNASRDTALTCFPRVELRDVV